MIAGEQIVKIGKKESYVKGPPAKYGFEQEHVSKVIVAGVCWFRETFLDLGLTTYFWGGRYSSAEFQRNFLKAWLDFLRC